MSLHLFFLLALACPTFIVAPPVLVWTFIAASQEKVPGIDLSQGDQKSVPYF